MTDSTSSPSSTEDALRRSFKELADLKFALDQSAIVATTDIAGTITYVNDKFCEISKYPREALIGRNHRILNSGLHSVDFFRQMYQTIGSGKVWRGELRNRARDGNDYWVDTTIVPLIDEHGKPSEYIAIRYDITARKQSEAALREQSALAQVGKMAAVVAHEVRNPLAAIRGALQVIGRRVDPQSAEHGIISEVISRVDGLNDIVQDLLMFARPRPPVLAPLSVRDLLDSTLSLVQQDPIFADIVIAVGESSDVISADAQQLRQVLLNLLINGAQATKGRGEITITVETVGVGCELRICDEGPGISREARDHLFEPFFTTKHRGTGLGLAIARRIIEAHGGTLRLECPPSGGTVAVVWVPKGTGVVFAERA